MKRLLATLLVLVMIFTALPVSISAEETYYVFGPGALTNNKEYAYEGVESTLVKDGDTIYIHHTVGAGEYTNNKLQIAFKPGVFAPADYPFIKIGYRSDSKYGKINLSARSGPKESWHGNGHPDMTADGKWHETILNLNELTGGSGLLAKGDTNAIVVFKPFGSGNVSITDVNYFDISYLAFFKTKSEAEAYKYTSSDDKGKLTDIISVDKLAEHEAKLKEEAQKKAEADRIAAEEAARKEAEAIEKAKEALANGPDRFIYGAKKLEAEMLYGVIGFDYELVDGSSFSYLHATVKPGTYNHDKLLWSFAPNDYSVADYQYIKIGYRTDSFHNKLNFSSRSVVGESWHGAGHPDQITDGQWHDIILDTKTLTGGKGLLQSGDTTAYLVFKPYSSQNVTVTKDSYFDVKYIACFRDKAAAEAFKYDPAEHDLKASTEDLFADALKKDDGTKLSELMAETDALRDEILASPTTVTVTGKKYYVSASGNDSNSGLSPEKPWKSITKVNSASLKPGDGVFFKRGDSFRTNSPLSAKSGVTYSAYGEGAKPQILASKNANGSANWIETEHKNIYAYANPLKDSQSVGNIIFDGGDAWGIQIQRTIDGNWLKIGEVYNGLEWYKTPEGKMDGHADLCYDLQFYHDWDAQTLYLYSKDGNPGERFSSIEIVTKMNGVGLQADKVLGYAHDIVVDNLEIYGAGVHGIGGGTVKDVTVQYCVLKWIGGSIQGVGLFNSNYGVRLGNAVESYGSSENFTIKYCYATQIYDCCWTVQCQANATFKNISMHHNVSELCNTGLEIWNDNGVVEGLDLHDNYTRFNGYGWSYQRPNKDSNFFYGGAGGLGNKFENNNIYNNVNLLSRYFAYKVRTTGPEQYNFHDNIYLMEEGKKLGGIASNPGTGVGAFNDQPYDAKSISRALSTGFEKGSSYYVVDPKPYGDMFDLYVPEKVGINVFEDIPKNFWGKVAINYVVGAGYFNGTSQTTFAPDGTMTRAMLVTVLSRMAGVSGDTSKITYTDVNKNAWYAPGVAWAEETGIVKAGGKFRPDENATREELADMLYKTAYYSYIKTDISGTLDFKDAASVKSEYADGVKFCTKNGIIGGYSDGTIKPANSATRAEVATMIMRFVKSLQGAPIDEDRVFAASKSVKLDATALKSMSGSFVMKAVDDPSMLKFVPSAKTGKPNINIYNIKNTDISFIDYPYAVIKYESNIESDNKTLIASSSTGAAITDSNVTMSFSATSGAVIFDLSEFAEDKASGTYIYDAVIRIFPWGTHVEELAEDSYFGIKEIAFFDTPLAAEVYAQR